MGEMMKMQINRSVVLLSLVLLTLSTALLSIDLGSLYAGDKRGRGLPSIGPSLEETDIAVNNVLAHLDEIQNKFVKDPKFQQILLTYGEKWVFQKLCGIPTVSMTLDEADRIVGFGLILQILDDEGNVIRYVGIELDKNLEITEISDFCLNRLPSRAIEKTGD